MPGPLRVDLGFLLGDTWSGPAWAVVRDGAAVDLADGWAVRAQARRRPEDEAVLMEWSTANGRVVLGSASVTLSDGTTLATSTVQLAHTAAAAAALPPFVGRYDCEISRDGTTYTITEGQVTASRDVSR